MITFYVGRGRNSWVSQSGALQFSMILRHNVNIRHAPVVFIQYIIALAVVESIRERPGYEDIPLRLKWPNDIYTETKTDGLKKVGGLLINSSFIDDEFVLVIGKGIRSKRNIILYIYILCMNRMWYQPVKS
jgi:biotin--protein ligase